MDMIDQYKKELLLNEAKNRFINYVKINTQSDPESGKHPSTSGQMALADVLKNELKALGLDHVELDSYGYVYAILPGSKGIKSPSITFCSHMDTSPAESGDGISPVIHQNYDGGNILFPDNKDLILTPEDSPELSKFIGENIITASGNTLLGADDKAGIAEIMAALVLFQKYEDLIHPELRIVFTPDEEIGEGTLNIDIKKLGKYGYTIDGGEIGELEDECFNAYEAKLIFKGKNIHPGSAKNKLVNAGAIASRFLSQLPEYETPEHTEKREGFFHLTQIKGNENHADLTLILRDFEKQNNLKRIELIKNLMQVFKIKYQGLDLELIIKDQYSNMSEILKKHPEVVNKADKAMQMSGIKTLRSAIRGGTDGSRLSFIGKPTPNIFSGGVMFHSKKEWIPEIALQKGAEVIVNLCRLWAKDGYEPTELN